MTIQGVHERQLQPELIEIQRAAASLQRRVQWISALRLALAVLLAAAGLLSSILGNANVYLSVGGFVLTVVTAAVLNPLVRSLLRGSAVMQEKFDCAVFKLHWNDGIAGPEPSIATIHNLAMRTKLNSARGRAITKGWYDKIEHLSWPRDVLLCQEQNVLWDQRLRQRFITTLTTFCVIWVTAGVTLALVGMQSVQDALLTFFVPSLPVLSVAVDFIVCQFEVLQEKKRLSEKLRHASNGSQATVRRVCREVQDGIYYSRTLTPRVPYVLYALFRKSDEADFLAETTRRDV